MILRVLRSSAAGAIGVTLLLFAALAFKPVPADVALDAYVLLLGAIVLTALVRTATERDPDLGRSPYDQALEAEKESGERPPELARVERELELAVGSAFYEHFRLRPLLRELAVQRLGARYAAELDGARGEAREALPEHAWELLDIGRQPPRDRHGAGIPVEHLREIVNALERMERPR